LQRLHGQKKIECWIIWVLIDVVATYVYYIRDIKFYSIQYFMLTIIAAFAVWNWIKEYRGYRKIAA